VKSVSRFTFLKRAGSVALVVSGAGAVAQLGRAGSGDARPPTPQFYGIVTDGTGDGLLVRPPHTPASASPAWTLVAAPGALVWHLDGASLSDFSPGEEVIAFGNWVSPTEFQASRVAVMLYPLSGRVQGRSGSQLVTSKGTLDLSHLRPGQAALQRLSPGQSFDASGLRNIDTGQFHVFDLAIESAGNAG